MSDNSDNEAVKCRWLCWTSRVLLIAASLSRLVYAFYYTLMFPGLGDLELAYFAITNICFTVAVIIVTIIAWFAPRVGGIFALVCILLQIAYLIDQIINRPHDFYDLGIIPQTIFLAAGGILSIIWGSWRKKNKERQI
jgi:hypothetical protein